MKKYLLILVILTAFSINSVAIAKTTTIKQHDRRGNYQGKMFQMEPKQKFIKRTAIMTVTINNQGTK